MRLLLADRQQESRTVYTDGFRAYEPLEEDDVFDRDTPSTATANTLTARCMSTTKRATRRS
jgi:transposase-like protein